MSNPFLVQVPFAYSGNKNPIQIERQAGQDDEDATYKTGFPPITMVQKELGGKPPKGLDFNGIFYELSSPIAHYCKGGRIYFDKDYANAIGGYPKGHIITANDDNKDYISLVDNNKLNPNTSNITGFWRIYAGSGSVPTATSTTTGTVKLNNTLTSNKVDAALTAAQGKKLQDGKLNKTDVVNTLLSTDASKALSAAQGKVLKDIIDRFVFFADPNGYIEIPFGNQTFMIQWGVSKEYVTNSFPKPFPNACLNISATVNIDGGIADSSVTTAHIVSRSQFRVYCGTSTGSDIFWLAIGY